MEMTDPRRIRIGSSVLSGCGPARARPAILAGLRDGAILILGMIHEGDQRPAGDVLERTRSAVKQPILFKVILHNDDYTTMAFVVEILEAVFFKPPAEAYRIMMKVHTEGNAICGLYTHEIAESKVAAVHAHAQRQGFPLRASLEPD
jgi:ATP-dependent Clp protease adaptor protein ClpS